MLGIRNPGFQKTMALLLDGNPAHVEGTQMKLLSKLYTCAHFSELPSNISTMPQKLKRHGKTSLGQHKTGSQ